VIYTYLDKIKRGPTLSLMRDIESTQVPVDRGMILPDDARMAIVHGVKRGMDEIIQQCIQKKCLWMYMDHAGNYFPKSNMFKRVIINGTAPITYREGKRFEHNVKLREWRGGQGKNIIVLPPSIPYMDTFDQREFLNSVCNTVNIYTGKDIIVRAKPAKGRKAKSWDEQLKDAYAVITWGSALALDAMIKGVPTISLGWCPAKLSSFDITDLETDKLLAEPPRIETLDNLTWCCFRSQELSEAYYQVLETARSKSKYNEKLQSIDTFKLDINKKAPKKPISLRRGKNGNN